jgi:hypothetical protein
MYNSENLGDVSGKLIETRNTILNPKTGSGLFIFLKKPASVRASQEAKSFVADLRTARVW